MVRGSIVFSCGFFSSSSSPFCFLSSYIFFNFLFLFQREKKYTHIFTRKKKKKNGIHETVCNDTKTTTESQKKKEKKKCQKSFAVEIIVCSRGRDSSRLLLVHCGSFFFFFCWMYLFSFNPLFKKYLFLFVLFETCPPFNFPAGVFFLTFNIHR